METSEIKGAGLYETLTKNRTSYLDRARSASLLTIPQLYPPEGSGESTAYPTPYQSLGAKGTNNLANKMVLSLFPPNTAYFKMSLSPADMTAIGLAEGEVKSKMYNIERAIVNEQEVSALRPKLVHLMKLLLVGGSAVIYVPDEGSPEVFRLDTFGVKRDKKGNVLRLCIKQSVAFGSLPLLVQNELKEITDEERQDKKMLDMYTCIVRVDGEFYEVWQEVKSIRIKATEGKYKADNLPYRFIPFVDTGEDYGRSYIEDFIGDLQSYEGLRQSILEGAAESARIIYLVNPNSTLSPNKLKNAKSGDALTGLKDDVSTIQSDKRLDLSVTQQEAQTLRQDLAMTFLLDSAVVRQAERVTAEEIRQVSQELEVAVGGIYSTLSKALQYPMVMLYMNRLIANKKLDSIIRDSSSLEITTGSAALGRGADFNVLKVFVATLAETLGPEALQQYLNLPEFISRAAYALDINTASLVLSPQELQQKQQMQQQQALEQQVAPVAAKAQLENPPQGK